MACTPWGSIVKKADDSWLAVTGCFMKSHNDRLKATAMVEEEPKLISARGHDLRAIRNEIAMRRPSNGLR